MASSEVVQAIIDIALSSITYLLPVIAILAAITFIFTFLIEITIGWSRKIPRG